MYTGGSFKCIHTLPFGVYATNADALDEHLFVLQKSLRTVFKILMQQAFLQCPTTLNYVDNIAAEALAS